MTWRKLITQSVLAFGFGLFAASVTGRTDTWEYWSLILFYSVGVLNALDLK